MIGFRVRKMVRRVDAHWVQQFRLLPVANLSDVMSRMSAGGAALHAMHAMHAGGRMVGTAVTVKTRPGDNLMVHKALDIAHAGDVVVVDAGGDVSNAIIGELMVASAEQRGLAGLVIYGAIRDSEEIAAGAFPVFATGVTHRGPYKDGPGEVNVPIAIEGMVIEPGDLVCGDGDGLLSIPFDRVAIVHGSAARKHADEIAQRENIRAGRYDRAWIDTTLSKLGCDFEA